MRPIRLIFTILLTLTFVLGTTQKVKANVFASNIRVTQPDSDLPFDGRFDDGSGALIRFVLSDNADTVTVNIWDSANNLVRTIVATNYNIGDTSVVWDGKDDLGGQVSNDNYTFSVTASNAGHSGYTTLFYDQPSIFTRGVTTIHDLNSRNFGFVFTASGGGYLTGIGRHAADLSQWGDVKGNASRSYTGPVPVGPGEFRYSSEADEDGYVYLLRRNDKELWRYHVDTMDVQLVDSGGYDGTSRLYGVDIAGEGNNKFVAIAGNEKVFGFELNGPTYFGPKMLLLDGSNKATDLFISEYIEGSSSNKALEIFNGTGADVDLSNYRMLRGNNGGTTSDTLNFPAKMLANGDVYVINNPSDTSSVIAAVQDTTSSITFYNGDDALLLQKNDGSGNWTTIDVIGVLLQDPGTGWNVAGVSNATSNHTLVRKPTVKHGNPDWASSAGTDSLTSEWLVYAQNDFSFIGSHSTEPSFIFWDVQLGEQNILYATFYRSDDGVQPGVAKFDFSSGMTTKTMADTLWTVRVPGGRASTLDIYHAPDSTNNILYFVQARISSGNPASQNIWAVHNITTNNPTMEVAYNDLQNNITTFRADISVDVAGNIVFFENSNEETVLISPPSGWNQFTTPSLDPIKVFQSEAIADVKVDANGDFVPDRLNDVVTVIGIVNSINFTASSNRFSYNIQDATGGINITKGSETGGGPVFNIGDRLKVTGTVGQFRGTTQLNLTDVATDVELVDAGNSLTPIVLTIEEYLADPEKYESMLIQINNVAKTASSSDWPSAGSSSNMTIWDGFASLTLRVDSDSDLDDNTEPTYPINVKGIATQFTFATPPNDGYQISPNFYADITQGVAAPPTAYFFLKNPANGGDVIIADSNQTITFDWTPTVDLNGDAVIYQFNLLSPAKQSGVLNDTLYTVDGTTVLGWMGSQDTLATKWTVKAKGAEATIVGSVDTFDVRFINSIVVSVENEIIPTEFYVEQNFPNPFNPSTTIRFGLPSQSRVDLRVYNILGQEVAVLLNGEEKPAGTYNINFNASSLASGTYIYRLRAGDKVVSKKMILLK